jgi:hypothetical protein
LDKTTGGSPAWSDGKKLHRYSRIGISSHRAVLSLLRSTSHVRREIPQL